MIESYYEYYYLYIQSYDHLSYILVFECRTYSAVASLAIMSWFRTRVFKVCWAFARMLTMVLHVQGIHGVCGSEILFLYLPRHYPKQKAFDEQANIDSACRASGLEVQL